MTVHSLKLIFAVLASFSFTTSTAQSLQSQTCTPPADALYTQTCSDGSICRSQNTCTFATSLTTCSELATNCATCVDALFYTGPKHCILFESCCIGENGGSATSAGNVYPTSTSTSISDILTLITSTTQSSSMRSYPTPSPDTTGSDDGGYEGEEHHPVSLSKT